MLLEIELFLFRGCEFGMGRRSFGHPDIVVEKSTGLSFNIRGSNAPATNGHKLRTTRTPSKIYLDTPLTLSPNTPARILTTFRCSVFR